jgi:hypothetical protein
MQTDIATHSNVFAKPQSVFFNFVNLRLHKNMKYDHLSGYFPDIWDTHTVVLDTNKIFSFIFIERWSCLQPALQAGAPC